MNRAFIIAPLFVLPFYACAACAGDETARTQSAIAATEKTSLLRQTAGANPDRPELQACAVMDTATDPRVLASAMLAGLNPKTYLSFMQKLTDPEALRHYLAAATPESTLDKAYSATDPEFQHALLSRATPQKVSGDWQQAMRDPAYFQSAVYVSDRPVQWVNIRADGRQTGAMLNWFDPRTYLGWVRLMSVPRAQDAKASSAAGASPAPAPMLFSTPPQRY